MFSLILSLLPFIVIIIIVLIVKTILKQKNDTTQPTQSFPYEKADALFTQTERSFLGVLDQAVGDQFRVFGKIRLADVIQVKKGLNNSVQQSAFNSIQNKHLDFVVCDSSNLSIQFAAELDDSSHAKAQRKERDEFLDKAMAESGIPLFHFAAKKSYSIQDVRGRIFDISVEEP